MVYSKTAMNRARTTLKFLRLSSRLLSTRPSTTTTTRQVFNQVTHFSSLSPSPLTNHTHFSLSFPHSFNTHYQILHFSSRPNSVVELLLANDWSSELQNELEDLNPTLTYETVIYVLKKLDKDPEKAWDFFNWVSLRDEFRASSPLYSLLLRILVKKDSMKKFWICLRTMKEQGFYIDEETFTTILGIFKKEKMENDAIAFTHFFHRMVAENGIDNVVKNVVNIVVEREWSEEVERELKAMGILLTDNFVIRVLKELRNKPMKASSFFHWVGKCEGYEHNTVTYNAAARVLGRDDSIVEFWSVVEEMKNAGHEMDIDTYIKISRQFQKNKSMENAVKLYEFMMDGPFKPSVQDCNILLRSISVSGNPDLNLVFRVVKKFAATGSSLPKAVYDGIHRSLTSAGEFDKSEQIMKDMRNAGYKPDNIAYSQLVFGLCKAGRFEEARKVLDDMEASGCMPDIKTWTILIQGHCTANKFEEALICFAKMIEKNYTADADLVATLVDGFLSQKGIDGAYTFLIEMIKHGQLRPWQATYKLLIEKLLEVRKFEEAINLLRLMKKHEYPPFAEPFVKYISKYGTVDDAAELLKALSVKEYPSVTAYLHVFKSFFQEGRHSEAKDLLYRSPYHIRKHKEICKLFGPAESSEPTG